MKKYLCLLMFLQSPLCAAFENTCVPGVVPGTNPSVTAVCNVGYSAMNSPLAGETTRYYNLYYNTADGLNNSNPDVVAVHGGGYIAQNNSPQDFAGPTVSVWVWLAQHHYNIYTPQYTQAMAGYTYGGAIAAGDLTVGVGPRDGLGNGNWFPTSATPPFTLGVDSETVTVTNVGAPYTPPASLPSSLLTVAAPGFKYNHNANAYAYMPDVAPPVQAGDLTCFLAYLGHKKGVSGVPGDPGDIRMWGISAGTHAEMMSALVGAPLLSVGNGCEYDAADLAQTNVTKALMSSYAGDIGCSFSFCNPGYRVYFQAWSSTAPMTATLDGTYQTTTCSASNPSAPYRKAFSQSPNACFPGSADCAFPTPSPASFKTALRFQVGTLDNVVTPGPTNEAQKLWPASTVLTLMGMGHSLDFSAAPPCDGTNVCLQSLAVKDGLAFIGPAPTADNQSVTTSFNAAHAITLVATDANSLPLTYSIVTGPAHGSLSGSAPNFTYTPNNGYSGADILTFKVSNGVAESPTATVSITVTAPNPVSNRTIVAAGSTIYNAYPVTDGSTYQGNGTNQWNSVLTVLGWPAATTPLNYSGFVSAPTLGEFRCVWVDPASHDIFVGGTQGPGFATTPGVVQPVIASGSSWNAALCRFSSAGVKKWCTYIGTPNSDYGELVEAIDGIDANGNLAFTGHLNCKADGTMIDGVRLTRIGNRPCATTASGMAGKIKADGSALVWLTEFSGSNDPDTSTSGRGRSTMDAQGNIYGQGTTQTVDFPVTAGVFQPTNRSVQATHQSGVVYKVKADGSGFAWASFIGGTGPNLNNEEGLILDSSNNLYMLTWTQQADFYVGGATGYQKQLPVGDNKGGACAITKIANDGSAILASTYFGGLTGGINDIGHQCDAIVLDGAGHLYTYGHTTYSDLPTTPGAFMTTKPSRGGSINYSSNFVSEFSNDLSTLLTSTYIGGNPPNSNGNGDYHQEQTGTILLDPDGNVWFHTGSNSSSVGGGTDYPTTPNAYSRHYIGNQPLGDMVVAALNPSLTSLVYGSYFSQGTNGTPRSNTWGQIALGYNDSASPPPAPTLTLATFLGGSGIEQGRGIAVDGGGNIYVVGGTTSADFPIKNGRPVNTQAPTDPTCGQNMDAFVAKFSPGGQLLWSTAIGGPNYDRAYDVQLDRSGNVFVSGRGGIGFPVTAGAFQTTFAGWSEGDIYGQDDSWIAKLDTNGQVLWASYVGTTPNARSIAVDSNGDVYSNLVYHPAVPDPAWYGAAFAQAYIRTPKSSNDGGVVKISGDGTTVKWATWVDWGDNTPNGTSGVGALQVDAAGNVYLMGNTQNAGLTTTTGPAYKGNGDLYLAKLSADGSSLLYATYFGGSGDEYYNTHNMTIDSRGNAYTATQTSSPDLPTTPGAFQRSMKNATGTIQVSKFSPTGALLASTYLGGSAFEDVDGISVDPQGYVYVSGYTNSADFPVTAGAYQTSKGAGSDAVFVKLNPDLGGLSYSTFIGGAGGENSRVNTLDGAGNYYLFGQTDGPGWPTVNAYQPTFKGGGGDAVLAVFSVSAAAPPPPNQSPTAAMTSPADGATFVAGGNLTLSATAADADGTVAKVDFYKGTTLLGSAVSAPYSFTWTNPAAGTYSLTAKAYDNLGATGTSAVVTITIKAPNQPPTVSVTSPVNGATFTTPATIVINATAADADGTVAKVDFYQGGVLLGTDVSSPYTFTWANVPSGSYSLTARATDDQGAATTSNVVTVTVNPPANQPPTAAITSPADGTVFTAPASITINGTAVDSDGTIAKAEFYQGSTLLGTDVSAPYSFNWANVPAGSYTLTIKAYDNLGATTISPSVNVGVDAPANQPPTVSVTSPLDGATLTAPASITINAAAADADGTVTKVDFFENGVLLGTDNASPYTLNWTLVPAGTYHLTARATDNQGATATSGAVTVTVNTSAPPPFCGDGTCNGSETCSSCPSDCGVCPVPPPDSLPSLDTYLSTINRRTYLLTEEIRFNYPRTGVTYAWGFSQTSSPAGAGRGPMGSPPVAAGNDGLIGSAPAATTSVPRFTPATLGLGPGTFQMTVTVTQGSQSVSATVQVTFVSGNLSGVKVYPNPWRSDKHAAHASVTFDGLTVGTTIKIFTVAGHLVKELHTDGPSVPWDLTNDAGDKAASGVYLYVITDSQGDKVRGKLAVIK